MIDTRTEKAMLETVELPMGTVIHYSGHESGVSFVCKRDRRPGDFWSQYQSHVTCPQCKAWIAKESEPK